MISALPTHTPVIQFKTSDGKYMSLKFDIIDMVEKSAEIIDANFS